jgi:tetratricopeptide (TPR) repeat protein
LSLVEKSGEPVKLALVMNTLASVLADKREYQEAQALCRRAGAILEGSSPDSHYYLAVTIANLGGMQTAVGEHQEGRESELRALNLVSADPLPDNILRATILHNLGNAAAAEKNFPEAVGYYEQALGWREKVLGREHPANAGLLFDYAVAAASAGERSLANQLRKRAKQLLARQRSDDWSRYMVDAAAFAHSR